MEDANSIRYYAHVLTSLEYILKQKFSPKTNGAGYNQEKFRRLEYGNLRHNTESQDGVLLVNSTATYFENDRILLEEAAVGNQLMSVMIQEGQYGLLWIHSTNL